MDPFNYFHCFMKVDATTQWASALAEANFFAIVVVLHGGLTCKPANRAAVSISEGHLMAGDLWLRGKADISTTANFKERFDKVFTSDDELSQVVIDHADH